MARQEILDLEEKIKCVAVKIKKMLLPQDKDDLLTNHHNWQNCHDHPLHEICHLFYRNYFFCHLSNNYKITHRMEVMKK